MHFAPTGSVCDYVQEIGRAARKPGLKGNAIYHYSKNDFKYINRLHGLSSIKNHQLIEVIEKICAIHQKSKRKSNLLLDTQTFTYIFNSGGYDSDNINKVKMALLMIQRAFEFDYGFSPITVRPVPLYSVGFFEINVFNQVFLRSNYRKSRRESPLAMGMKRRNF